MKVRHVLHLPTILEHLLSSSNYCHVASIIICKLERRTITPSNLM
jgi:hypothetical protein